MISYSQNGEDLKISEWFGDYKGTILSIGENDGQTLSNAYGLILKGWQATLVEPAPKAFEQLKDLHAMNENVYCINVAVGNENKAVEFFDSGSHLGKDDTSLLSTISQVDYNKWRATANFEKITVEMVRFEKVLSESPYKTFDFVSIDAEGYDMICLAQMDLTDLDVKVLCIEYNGDNLLLQSIKIYCAEHGLTKELLRNAENIILTV